MFGKFWKEYGVRDSSDTSGNTGRYRASNRNVHNHLWQLIPVQNDSHAEAMLEIAFLERSTILCDNFCDDNMGVVFGCKVGKSASESGYKVGIQSQSFRINPLRALITIAL